MSFKPYGEQNKYQRILFVFYITCKFYCWKSRKESVDNFHGSPDNVHMFLKALGELYKKRSCERYLTL